MEPRWLVNGRETGVAASDRGLAYGDGLFETMAMRGGRVRWLEQHLERLRTSCTRLAIPAPDADVIRAELEALAPRDGSRCVAKVIVTRGSSGRGYRPPAEVVATRVTSVSAWPAYPASHYATGIGLAICRTPASENPALAGLKHLCRLEQVLAQQELATSDHVEGLMSTPSGHVIGGTMSNVFCLERSRLLTPRVDRAGVSGVMRAIVMRRAAAAGIDVCEDDLTLDRLTLADEVFVTNAVFGLWPVRAIGAMKIRRGELAERLIREIGVDTVD